ncbi:phosphonate ABC transporter, permease protein PhnE [Pontibacillus litoralis]|uniref:Alkylphosphonate ABC transporter permease n=1 Tax=Pontibacillus litoralis JSM 072002 TaxID=1385512 RepID=A0A0A5G6T3_9BACI|nr:phosphonate ABC transporter, permease protein PhnE [Pontibacillus litoralis]KGX87759.1 alkylphosphonate ABC transporter permease [Pontibacillus litoralis JSM 072002]
MNKPQSTQATNDSVPVIKGLASSKQKLRNLLILLIVGSLYLYSSIQTESFITRFNSEFFSNVGRMLGQMWPPNMEFASTVWPKLAETVQMAVIGTSIAAMFSLPLSLLASYNIIPSKIVYRTTKFFLNVLRTIPEILLAVIFISLVGIGVFPGILALAVFSVGILAKLMSDTIESIDMNQVEALRASGANTLQVIHYAVLPQIMPQFASFSLYVFEINVRASVVLGFVGAGGVGLLLNQQISFFNYPNAMALTIIIYVVVVFIDYISNKIREALL